MARNFWQSTGNTFIFTTIIRYLEVVWMKVILFSWNDYSLNRVFLLLSTLWWDTIFDQYFADFLEYNTLKRHRTSSAVHGAFNTASYWGRSSPKVHSFSNEGGDRVGGDLRRQGGHVPMPRGRGTSIPLNTLPRKVVLTPLCCDWKWNP